MPAPRLSRTPEVAPLHSASVPLTEAFEGFLAALGATKPSPHTLSAYDSDLRVISSLMAEDPDTLTVADLTKTRLQVAFGEHARTHEKASVLRAWSVWNRFCDHLVVVDLLAGNPMAAVGKPKAQRASPRAFSDQDMAALLDTLVNGRVPARYPWPLRDYAIITTLAVTGLRRSELVAVHVEDIEGTPGAKTLAVRQGKGDKYRAIPLDPRLEHLLETYLTERWTRYPSPGRPRPQDPWSAPPRAPLWIDDRGRAMSGGQLAHLVQRAYRAAGINSHRPTGALVHALRHTFATTLIENGATAIEVMTLLGHSSLATTQRYLATRPDHLRQAIAANPLHAKLSAGSASAAGHTEGAGAGNM